MDFNNVTDKNGIIQNCEVNLFGDSPFGSISSNSDRLNIFTNFINDAYNKYAILALMSDNSWQFDDSNYTTFPIGTTNMVANQPDYTLSTEQIIIDQVEVLDPTGTIWMALPEMDERQFAEFRTSLSQYYNNVAAVPQVHCKIGNSIYIYPAPSYSVTNGIKVRFKRAPDYFVSTDTTKKPGVPVLHHDYFVDAACAKYAKYRSMPIAKQIEEDVRQWETVDIPTFFADRSLEHPTKLQPILRSSR